MAELSARDQVILAKIEVTEGTDPTPVKADDALEAAAVMPDTDFQQLERIAIQSGIAAAKQVFGRKTMRFTVTVELKGSGAAGTAPDIGPLLQACGMDETVNAGTSVVYTPFDPAAAAKTITVYIYKAGLLFKLHACRGNAEVQLVPGNYCRIVFSMQGKFGGVTDAALPSSPTYQSTIPVQGASAGISFGAFNDAVVSSLNLSTGNQIIERADLNSTEGLKGWALPRRDPQITASVEATVEATCDWWDKMEDRDEEAVDATIGTVAGNIVELAAPKVALANIALAEESDLLKYSITAQALPNAGNDNYSITFK